jgi:hypothetical protein
MKQRQAVTVTVQRYRQGSKKVSARSWMSSVRPPATAVATPVLCCLIMDVSCGCVANGWLLAMCVRQRRQKSRCYDELVVRELIKLWELLNYSCGKRLVAILPELIVKLEQFGELRLAPSSRAKLLRISAATVDRLLQPERRRQQLRRRSHTKPGTLLKHQIPIRTFAEWDEQQPGFAEIDLVAHDGAWPSATIAKRLI